MKVKLFLSAFLMCLSSLALADANDALNKLDSNGFSKLSGRQQYEILQRINAAASSNAQKNEQEQAEVEAVSKRVAATVLESSKALNVAPGDFLHSEVGGKVAVAIMWDVASVKIIHVSFGLLILILGIIFTRILLDRLETTEFISPDAEKQEKETPAPQFNSFSEVLMSHLFSKTIKNRKLSAKSAVILFAVFSATIAASVSVAFTGW